MAISSANAAAAPKVRKVETLTSGTSWTVPTGVEFVNAKLVGGGGGGGNRGDRIAQDGVGGQVIETSLSTTPGASIAYAIGSGGSGAGANTDTSGSSGGTTTFTAESTTTTTNMTHDSNLTVQGELV